MDQNKFGVNLKRTGVDTRFNASASRTPRTTASIHTPLKPANVSDLKAMFDSSKPPSGTGTSSSSGKSSPRSSGATSPRSGTTSPRSGASSPGHSVLSAKKTDSSLSFSVAKGLSASSTGGPPVTTSTFSTSTVTSKSSSSRDNGFPSRINITTTASASETLTRILGSKLDEGKTEKSVAGPRPWSPREGSPLASKTTSQGLRTTAGKSFETRKAESAMSDNRVEIPVQHVTSGTKSAAGSSGKSNSLPGRYSAGQGVTTTVKSFQQTSGTPDKKTVTSGFSSSTSNQQFKSSLDKNKSAPTVKKVGSGTVIREIPVERVPSASNKTESSKAQRNNDKLRASLEKKTGASLEKKTEIIGKPKHPEVTDSKMLSTRKLSSERFERLKFDFERGVPTESHERRGSGSTDHIELQLRARELHSQKEEAEAEAEKLKKEESIFAQGMKVSDFVKHINTVHPPSADTKAGSKKWKAEVQKAAKTDAKQDSEGENEYIEMPEADSDQEGIYEFVADNAGAEGKGDKGSSGAAKTPGRRHGVYRKGKGRQASGKVKTAGAQADKGTRSSEADADDLNGSQEIVISSGEDEWDSDHSGSTNYEPVDDDNLYEDPDTLDAIDGGKKKKKEDKDGTKSLGNKLKKNVDKATNYLNKKFNKKKGTKDGTAVGSGGGAGTDSEGDLIDDDEVAEISSLSRTSSERSSGRLARSRDKELSAEASRMQGDEEDHGVPTPPPPLPPRAAKVISQPNVENSPPLPPRNPMAGSSNLAVNLDVVVPITPPASRGHSATDLRRKSDRFSFGRDSYLGSQEKLTHSNEDVSDSSTYELARPESYLDYDPASPRTLEKMERKDKSVTSSAQQSRGSYVYPDNISDWPQLHGDSDDEDLYIELADDQIYGRQDRPYSTKFESEPLYQWYAKDHIIRANRQTSISDVSGSGEDGEVSGDESITGDKVYEDVERLLQRASTRRGRPDPFERNAPARRSVIMDVFGKSGTLHRALWCEMPEVIKSGVLLTMDPQEKKVQESMFEIMTSEASYLKSLNVLINVFLMAPEFSADMSDRCIVTKRERQFLFSNIGTIRDISSKFLADLEARWQESCIMNDICDIIAKHAEKNFEPYIRYCSNQAFQERALETLQKRPDFLESVKRLEQNSDCQFLPMSSFLLLPMQRITRLPLLVDAIRHRIDPDTKRHSSATKALDCLNHVVKQCNEGAKKMLQTEQMCLLAANIEFNKVKEFPLVSSSRYLVKQGELNKIVTEGTSRIPFGKALGKSKEHVYLYLFNDILLITKKRGTVYQVRDYCQRNSLHTEPIDSTEKSKFLPQGAAGSKNLFLLALLANHEGKQVEIVLSAKSESERTRWLDAILPQQSNPEYERIYEDWDCPQVQCVEKYIAQEPDELTLEESDVINVFKKMADGWYEGERIRDGERGWFPADHTEEINNSHVRARNLRLRYRLMIASQEYTDMKFQN